MNDSEPMEEDDFEEDPGDPSKEPKEVDEKEEYTAKSKNLFFKLLGRHYPYDSFKGEKGVSVCNITVTSAAFMPSTKLLV